MPVKVVYCAACKLTPAGKEALMIWHGRYRFSQMARRPDMPAERAQPPDAVVTTDRPADPVTVLRDQFMTLHEVGQQLNLNAERERRVLLIDHSDWVRWAHFLQNGPLPAQPAVPVMLRRLAAATYRLAAVVERHAD